MGGDAIRTKGETELLETKAYDTNFKNISRGQLTHKDLGV